MNKRSFLKGLLGIGATAAASTLPIQIKAEVSNSEIQLSDLVNTINKLNWKMYNAFINNDISLVTESDYIKLNNAYDEYCSIFLKEDGEGSDVVLERAAFAKIKYHLLNKNIKYADNSFNKYFGHLMKMCRIHFESDGRYNHASACKEYANHLLHAGYVDKAKTKIENFRFLCNEYALQKMQDKKIWNSVSNNSYNGGYKFRDNLCSNMSYC